MIHKRRKILKILSKPRSAIQGQVRTVIYNDKEINDETEINNYISRSKYIFGK